jgi:hypothetical protein
LRTSAIAGVAASLVLSLPAFGAERLDPTPTPTTAERSSFSHAQARALLDQVRSALSPDRSEGRATPPRTELTLQLADLRRALPALTPAERTSAVAALASIPPPSATCSSSLVVAAVMHTAHFCVHYDASRVSPAWATTTATTLEQVWSVEVDRLGFRRPVPDGDGLVDVYLQDLGAGFYGSCAPAQAASQSTASCVFDDDFDPAQFGGAAPYDSLRATAAHEFFHVLQFAYDTHDDTWFMEGTAVWAEDQVFGAVNDYVQYLEHSAIARPRVPADYSGGTGSDLYFRYGAVLFWMFLSEHFGDPGIVRRTWEYAVGPAYSLQAVTAALAERGWSFGQAFARFAVWNTAPARWYGDGALFPDTSWWRTARLGRGARGTGRRTVKLDHLTDAAMLIRPRHRLPRRTRLRIAVDGPAAFRMPHATVQVRRRNGSVRVLDVPLGTTGAGAIRVSFNPRAVRAVVVTLTNASTRMAGCGADQTARYSCAGTGADDGQVFAVRARVRLR